MELPELPNRVTKTVYLKSDTNPYGYLHVQAGARGGYFCYHKGVNTGIQETPQLAAFVLHKLCEAQGIAISLVEFQKEVTPYPECSLPAPDDVDLKQIEYLKDASFKSGYKDVLLQPAHRARVFACSTLIDGVAYRTLTYKTPAEAAWALHTRDRVKINEAYKLTPELLAEDFGKPDLAQLDYLIAPHKPTGYAYVFNRGAKYAGAYSVDGIMFYTKTYRFREQAAWAVHHHLVAAGDRRGTPTKRALNQRLPINGLDLTKKIRDAYTAEKAVVAPMLAAKPVIVHTMGTFKNGKQVEHEDF